MSNSSPIKPFWSPGTLLREIERSYRGSLIPDDAWDQIADSERVKAAQRAVDNTIKEIRTGAPADLISKAVVEYCGYYTIQIAVLEEALTHPFKKGTNA